MKKNVHYARYVLWALPLLGVGLNSAQAGSEVLMHDKVSNSLATTALPVSDNGFTNGVKNIAGVKQTNVTIKGRVTGEDGTGLPGVTVQVKGTTQGTSTDVEGNYTVTAPSSNATLVFSYIGYVNQEVAVNNRSSVNVSLKPDVKALEEVVVTGYGTQRKADVVVAVASVEGEAVAERGTVNPLQAVQGQVAGVDIAASSGRAGAGFDVQIRGQNSLAGGSPLYVVDGVIVGDINFLNPQDIEKMDILKDAASTAIYGSRGSNGVVIVTTKQGSSVQGGATISYDGYYGVRDVARMPDFFSGAEWWEYRRNSYITPELLAGRDNYDQTIDRLVGLENNPTLRQRVENGEYTNWRDLVLQTGTQMNHWLSVSGTSNNNIQYVVGAGYQNEKGNLINEYFDRYNFKASIDHKLTDRWSAGASFNFSLTEMERGSDLAVTNAFRMSPLVSPYDAEGNLAFRPGQIPGENGTVTSFTSSVNPLLDNANSENNTRRSFGVGNLYLQFSPANWIDLRSSLSPSISYERNGRYWGSQTEARGGRLPAGQMGRDESFSYIMDNLVTVRKSLDDHNFTFTGLHSIQKVRGEGNDIRVNDLPFNSSFYNLGSSTNREVAGSYYEEWSLMSFMGRINYSFRDKFLVTLANRWDGASRLSEGHKWSSFPSVALGWRVSEEEFMKSVPFIYDLKARVSVGVSGNNNAVDPYGTQANLSDPYFYDFGGSLALGYAPSRLANTTLTWERAREYNVGLDYTLFQGRVSGTIDLYNKLSEGVIMERDLPLETGWENIVDNVGSVRNKGVELSLRTVNISTNDLTWTTTFNFARNKNAIVELLDKKEDLPGNAWFIGEPINVNYTYVFDGIWQESERDEALQYKQSPGQARVKDLNNDGVISAADDRAIIGQEDPKWTGGFSTQLTYKAFDLSASLFTRQGMQVLSPFHSEFILSSRGRSQLDFNYYMPENKVTPARASNEFPQPSNPGPYWSAVGNYRDASFVKVQNIVLGYNLPADLVERVKMKSLRVYANVLNPFVWTKYDGFDPEYASQSLVNTGVSSITYQLGVNLKF